MAKAVPADKHRGLAVAPVKAASAPEFPTRKDLYRKVGVGATLLASGLASAEPAARKPAPPPQQQIAETRDLESGSINGKALAKAMPTIKVFRSGGGIGPAEDMWQIEDVEAYLSWTMAKEGRLALQTKFKLDLEGQKLTLDGYDPAAKIGYVYVDKNDPERGAVSGPMKAKLDQWMKDRKVAILYIDVKRVPDQATLRGKVVKFLHETAMNPPNPTPTPPPAATPAPAKAAPAKPAPVKK
jgi:hypothetical protein